jgi:hypothetical protein
MTDYQCEGCGGPILDGQHITLTTFVLSVRDQQLANATIYHEHCYRPPAKDEGWNHAE